MSKKIYSINTIEHIDSEINCKVSFNEEHEIYKGHFPDQPITPGVCLVEMVVDVFNDSTNENFILNKAKTLKFLRPVEPHHLVDVKITSKQSEDGVNVTAIGKDEENTFFKFNISLVGQ